MELENRKYTILSFLLFSALCGFVFYQLSGAIADLFHLRTSNVLAGYSWATLSGVGSGLVGTIIFIVLSLNKTACDFIDEVFAELKKTTWPTGKETASSTVVVSIMIGIAVVVFFLMDMVWAYVFQTFYSGQ